MYTLYYSPGACCRATKTVLNELGQSATLIDRASVENYTEINPTGAVPVLKTDNKTLTEGVAILLHLLGKHKNDLLPESGRERDEVLEAMLFANATMHPSYNRLFYSSSNIEDETAKTDYLKKAADSINALWKIVNDKIGNNDYLVNNKLSPADILLTVYSDWGQYFPVNITLGENTERMIANIKARPSFQAALESEAA